MEIIHIQAHQKLPAHQPCAACIGHFDGVHAGHQALLYDTVQYAQKHHVPAVMITFDPDPLAVLLKKEIPFVTTLNERFSLAERYGMDEIVVLDFDEAMAELSPEAFYYDVLTPMNLQSLTCGYDFHFASHGKGDASILKELINNTFRLSVIEPVSFQSRKISTTWVIECLKEGNISLANQLLQHPFSLTGTVVKGQQVGRKLQFPTANITYEKGQILLKEGVYIAKAFFENKTYMSMVNIGHNPTFYADYPLTVEAHLLDFDGDLYQKELRIEFLALRRGEQKFSGAEALIKQLQTDTEAVRSYFRNDTNEQADN